MNYINFFLVSVFSFTFSSAYRILGLFPFNGPSHIIMFQELMKSLAERGHQVDVLSEIPLSKPFPNYTEIPFESGLPKIRNNFTVQTAKSVQSGVTEFVANMAGNLLCEKLGSAEIQNIIKNPPKSPPYDVVITEIFGAHCYLAIGHMLGVPVIGVSSADMYPWLNQLIGAPDNLAFFPNLIIDEYVEHMNFWWRLYNVVSTAYSVMKFNQVTSVQDEIMRRHLGPNAPSYEEVVSNVALVLVNNHIAISGVRDTTPALIDVGGLHIRENGPPIPKNVQKWIEESNGFIYFSFGSMIKIESLPRPTIEILYRSLEKISPIRVVMKIAAPEELPSNLPKNVLTAQWLPQTTILKHPKIKAFMTHGGLLSTQEAIHFGVPMIGMPIFADQFRNVHMSMAKNISVFLDVDKLTEKDMDEALHTILNDPIYRQSMKEMSFKFRDRPQSPAEAANYWIQYIIRHGSDTLKSQKTVLPWYQVYLLDVFLFILVTFFITISIVMYIVKLMIDALLKNDNATLHAKKIR